jgi:Phospholipase_D-nuclease N-terminal/Short C-terminal domain
MSVVAADYPFLDVLWTMLVFFAWVAWFWLLITVAGDIFRRHDIGGGKKAAWLIFMVFVPFIGVFAYLIANNDSMTRRNVEQAQAQQAKLDEYVRSVSDSGGGSAAAEIDRAKRLLDAGTITQTEYEAIKAKALA